ncbi:GIY-YIG nuclease family protein [Vibrio owensii]|nr:GIY-YIG nuclease family protein [Vibrio owensii]
MKRKPNGHWTLERCIDAAKKCETRSEFSKSSAGVIAKRNGWADLIEAFLPGQARMPSGYWTIGRCIEAAKKCETRQEFWRSPAGGALRRNGWHCEIEPFLSGAPRKPSGYWTIERSIEAAKKCETRQEFWEMAGDAVRKNGWHDEVEPFLPGTPRKPSGYWTIEHCIEAAKEFETRREFNKSSAGVIARRNGWLETIELFLPTTYYPSGYWTIERCIEVAKESETRSKFWATSAGRVVVRNGWHDYVATYLPKVERSSLLRCIYAITNDELRVAYVGLTYDFEKRMATHKTGRYKPTALLTEHFSTKFTQLTDYIPESDAQELERMYGEEYKQTYSMISRDVNYGQLGSSHRVTNTSIKSAALQCQTRTEFVERFPSEYNAARNRKMLDKVCEHMISGWVLKEPTDNELVVTALLYQTKMDFHKSSRSRYSLFCKRKLQYRIAEYLPSTAQLLAVGNSTGSYHTPHGNFISSNAAAKAIGISSSTIDTRCKKPDRIINSYCKVPKEWMGKTWREVGWWFEPK